MTQISRMDANLYAINGDGVILRPDENGDVTLTVDDWYFIIGGSRDSSITSIHLITGSAIAGVFTVEVSNLPRDKDDGAGQVADNSEVAQSFLKYDPSTAYVPTEGAGWSVTNLTLTKTAAADGSAWIDIGNSGAKRMRLKAAITTGGKCRVCPHAKSA